MRVFVGINFGVDIQGQLIHIQEQTRELAAKGRFFDPNNFHLTLRFIGEISEK